ncbi:Rrf2 family transcriptional regulator [Imbroritus primus]|uniref:Rrf2 family transcriptional regulator n=1 Tax=Imbroritus primus TaxID=3058603 RepID=A0ACD3SQF8_9BURK|nr:Rrf2 family transcriptional regulator [Burkholderiaceae bacterium PBA]
MRLTRFSDIGLRVLMYLASDARTTPVTVAEVAQQFAIPHNHLVKAVGALAKLGWVDATRGRHGGIRLGIAAEQLHIGTVLRALEGDDEVVDCQGLDCALSGDCLLRHALRAGQDAFYATMNRYTLRDIVGAGTGAQIIRLHREFLGRTASTAH